jgi:heat shock protein HtpX
MVSLHARMGLLVALLFSVIYGIIVFFGTAMGQGSFGFYLFLSIGLMLVQYLIGPKIVEWSMRVKYIQMKDNPDLFSMVEEQARAARIPMPRVGICNIGIPNAFAFGRGFGDGRVCVSPAIMQLLSRDELKAVIGHEVAHLRNHDVVTMTLLSVIPMIMYRIAWHFLWFGGGRGRDRGNAAMLGMAAFAFYFLTNLIVLYASRIREYYADKGAVEFGNRPEALASALYKLVYGSARMKKSALKETEGLKAFFLNDPSRAAAEIGELSQLDVDRSGTIDQQELSLIRGARLNLSTGDKMMEMLSTHPNMLKRIQHLSMLSS